MKKRLVDLVSDTLTNAEGYKLFAILDKAIAAKEVVQLSFEGATALSSSFLNSSIGDLIIKYGFEDFKSFIKFVEIKQSVANQLRNYLRSCDIQV